MHETEGINKIYITHLFFLDFPSQKVAIRKNWSKLSFFFLQSGMIDITVTQPTKVSLIFTLVGLKRQNKFEA